MYSGKILVAKPVIKDEVFARKAIFILTHSEEEGASGFIMNSKKIGKMMVAKSDDPNVMKLLESSKSLESVKDLAKNTKEKAKTKTCNDKFQPQPELSSNIVR